VNIYLDGRAPLPNYAPEEGGSGEGRDPRLYSLLTIFAPLSALRMAHGSKAS
jgi:hypothetical protein